MEHIDRQFLRCFPIIGYPHDQGENEPMRLFIKRMQCKLIAVGNQPDESHPIVLRRMKFLVRIEQIAKSFPGSSVLPFGTSSSFHTRNMPV